MKRTRNNYNLRTVRISKWLKSQGSLMAYLQKKADTDRKIHAIKKVGLSPSDLEPHKSTPLGPLSKFRVFESQFFLERTQAEQLDVLSLEQCDSNG